LLEYMCIFFIDVSKRMINILAKFQVDECHKMPF
jgi:hypothetical protein